jgi:hypothetical protein
MLFISILTFTALVLISPKNIHIQKKTNSPKKIRTPKEGIFLMLSNLLKLKTNKPVNKINKPVRIFIQV